MQHQPDTPARRTAAERALESETRRRAAGAVRKTLILPPDAAQRAGELMARRGVTFTGLVVDLLMAGEEA